MQIAINQCEYYASAADVTTTDTETTSGEPVPLDCNGTPITDYELAYYRPYFDLIYEYEAWNGHPLFNSCFVPVRLADSTFFNSVVCQENDPSLTTLYKTTEHEYSVRDPYLRFSFKEGQIAISYLRTKVDDVGFPMVPDDYSVKEAIIRYVRYKILSKKYDRSDSPATERKYIKAEQDWQWYCGQAGNSLMMPKTIDDMEDLTQGRSYLLPRRYMYYNFFGRRNQYEKQTWNAFENRLFYRGYPPYMNYEL